MTWPSDLTGSQFLLRVSQGRVPGHSYIRKFGVRPSIDTTDGEAVIWNYPNEAQYTYSSSADIDRVSSSSASDTGQLVVQGLTFAGVLTTQTLTLTGQTPVEIPIPLWRVFRMIYQNGADAAGNIFCFVNSAVTAGVPDVTANVRAYIDTTGGARPTNQTLMGIYTIPADHTGFAYSLSASIANKQTAFVVFSSWARPYGGIFNLGGRGALVATGTSHYKPPVNIPIPVPAMTDLEATANTGTSGVGVAGEFELLIVHKDYM